MSDFWADESSREVIAAWLGTAEGAEPEYKVDIPEITIADKWGDHGIAPLMVHTVTIGNLSYSWEDYATNINAVDNLHTALDYDAAVQEIKNVYVNEPNSLMVIFTTFLTSRYKGHSSPCYITAKITCHPKENE